MRIAILAIAACSAPQVATSTHEIRVDPWQRRTISAEWNGADGVDLADVNGDGLLDAVASWEGSSRITLSIRPGCNPHVPWPTTTIGTHLAAEDAKLGDLDGDGDIDAVSAAESKTIKIWRGPAWTEETVAASVDVQRWMQVALADVTGDGLVDIVAGGRDATPASLGYFAAPDWTWHWIADAGWIMSIIPRDVDGDGDIDLVVSDRTKYQSGGQWVTARLGTSWYENDDGAFAWHYVGRQKNDAGQNQGDPKMLAVGPMWIVDGASGEIFSRMTVRTTADWQSWTATLVPEIANVGRYQAVAVGDINGDTEPDLAVTHSAVPDGSSGVVWLRGPDFIERNEISGREGAKFDNVILHDVDLDGDLDVVTSEQTDGLGVVWFENPGPEQ